VALKDLKGMEFDQFLSASRGASPCAPLAPSPAAH